MQIKAMRHRFVRKAMVKKTEDRTSAEEDLKKVNSCTEILGMSISIVIMGNSMRFPQTF